MNTLQKTKLRGTGINCGLIVLLFAVVLLLGQVLPENTYRRVLIPIIWQMCIFILLGTSLNLTLGYLGQLTLGHMGFAGIGAYTAALSSLALERAGVFEASKAAPGQLILVILGCCLLGAIFAGLLGLLVGIPALRLHGDYLAIVTLAFGEIIKNIMNAVYLGVDDSGLHFSLKDAASMNMAEDGKILINGAMGITGIKKTSTFTMGIILVLITLVVVLNLIRSRAGRAISAIRDNEIAAKSIGINITRYKLMAFVLSSVFAGMAGVLYSLNYSSLVAKKFDYNTSINILVFVVLGGIGSIRGSVIAAAILTVLPEMLRGLNDYRMLIYAIVLILVMLATNNDDFKALLRRVIPGRKEEREDV